MIEQNGFTIKVCGRKVSLCKLTGHKNQDQNNFFFYLFSPIVLFVCMHTILHCTPSMRIKNIMIFANDIIVATIFG